MLSVGYGLHQAWVFATMFGTASVFGAAHTFNGIYNSSVSLPYLISSCVYVCALIFMALTNQRFLKAYTTRTLLCVGACLSCVGTFLLMAPPSTGFPLFELISGIMTGIGSATLIIYWGTAFARCDSASIVLNTAVAITISIVLFALVLAACGDVVVAMIAATASEAVWIACYDIPRLRRIRKVGRPDFSPRALVQILLACLPLFIGSFMSIYLGNVCKYAIDAVGTEHMQTVFNILFMPSFVINLFVNFFIRPSLTTLAVLWVGHRARDFMRILLKLLAVVLGITVAVELACALVGIPVLQLFYGVDLQGCLPALLVLLAGGGLLSASNVFYNAVVVIRSQNGVLIGYAVAIAVTTLVATPLVASLGIWGASIAYAVSCAALLASFGVIFALFAKAKMRYWKKEAGVR